MTDQTRTLGPKIAEWFEGRGINAETAARLGVFSARAIYKDDPESPGRRKIDRVIADPNGKLAVFQSIEDGVVVNAQYRDVESKFFFHMTGGKPVLWNCEVLKDQTLVDSDAGLIITEGMVDALTAIDCGFPFTTSVPNGAPSVPKHRKPDDLDPIDPDHDAEGKFAFVYMHRQELFKIRKIILAVDNDAGGKRLAAELVRRLEGRCWFVEYPDGCKDLNDVRKQYGADAVRAVIENAKPYPLQGIYELDEYPDLPTIETYSSGWPMLDDHFKPFLGELMFVLGIPGHGKSAWAAHFACNMAENYGWKTLMFSPEEPVAPFMRDKLRKIRMSSPLMQNKWGNWLGDLDREQLREVDSWIKRNFIFMATDPLGQQNEEPNLEWVLRKAREAVIRHGIKLFIIDPWNEMEQSRMRGESQTEYIGRALREINRFRQMHNVMVMILIHPTKEVGKDGKGREPTPYDADGSAHYFNKADHFLIVSREGDENTIARFRMSKVKFDRTGSRGLIKMKFDTGTRRYYELQADVPRIPEWS